MFLFEHIMLYEVFVNINTNRDFRLTVQAFLYPLKGRKADETLMLALAQGNIPHLRLHMTSIEDTIPFSCFIAFSLREPVSTSLENAPEYGLLPQS